MLFLFNIILQASLYLIKVNEKFISPLPDNSGTVENRDSRSLPLSNSSPEPRYYYGKASWYGQEYCDKHNPKCIMANGARFEENKFTAACSKKHQLGEKLLVSYKENSVEVVCTDRGSFKEKYGRDLDLSKAAFNSLAPISKGILKVRIEEL